ncbi:hypothetical protein ABZP36_007133 [Zizania latifolia]
MITLNITISTLWDGGGGWLGVGPRQWAGGGGWPGVRPRQRAGRGGWPGSERGRQVGSGSWLVAGPGWQAGGGGLPGEGDPAVADPVAEDLAVADLAVGDPALADPMARDLAVTVRGTRRWEICVLLQDVYGHLRDKESQCTCTVWELAEYCVVPANTLAVLPNSLPYIESAILGRAMFTAYGVLRHAAEMRAGDSVSSETLSRIRYEKARRYLSCMRKKHHVPFSQKFRHTDPLALCLLECLLVFDPKDRPSAEEALADPYFTSLANVECREFYPAQIPLSPPPRTQRRNHRHRSRHAATAGTPPRSPPSPPLSLPSGGFPRYRRNLPYACASSLPPLGWFPSLPPQPPARACLLSPSPPFIPHLPAALAQIWH